MAKQVSRILNLFLFLRLDVYHKKIVVMRRFTKVNENRAKSAPKRQLGGLTPQKECC